MIGKSVILGMKCLLDHAFQNITYENNYVLTHSYSYPHFQSINESLIVSMTLSKEHGYAYEKEELLNH